MRLVLPWLMVLLAVQPTEWMLSRDLEPDDVLKHFPLQAGNRWIYDTTYLTGDESKPDVSRWTWELRVTNRLQTPDGLVVLRSRRVLQVLKGEPSNEAGLSSGPYLVTKGYVYELAQFRGPEAIDTPDDLVRTVGHDQLDQARQGSATPEFFFPMRVGVMWAEREREDKESEGRKKNGAEPSGMYHWVVEGMGGRGLCECLRVPAKAFDIIYDTIGGPAEVFFQDGVGVVGEWTHHSGTYWEEHTTLQRFIPAGR